MNAKMSPSSSTFATTSRYSRLPVSSAIFLPLHVELYRRFFPFFLRFPFFGCVLLPPPLPPPLAIAARAVAALAALRVCAACSTRATTFRSGAAQTCGTPLPRFLEDAVLLWVKNQG